MAERLSSLSSLGFPPLGHAHPSLALHPHANSPPASLAPSMPLPDPRTSEELAQWNQYLVKLGEQVASSVYAHALGLTPPPPPPPQQYLDPATLAQFGLAGMPGILGLGLGLGGLPGLGILGAGGLGGVDYNAIAAYQQAQAQALAMQNHLAAGLYPGLDLSSLGVNPGTSTPGSASTGDASKSTSPGVRRPGSSNSRRSASASGESEFEFDALRPSRSGLHGLGVGVGTFGGEKRSVVVPLKAAPPAAVKDEDAMSVDESEDEEPEERVESVRLPPLAPVEPRLGMRTPGMPAKLGPSSGLYPSLPPLGGSSSSSSPGSEAEKITLPGIESLLHRSEPSFKLRPVTASPLSSLSSDDDEDAESSSSSATSRAGTPPLSSRATPPASKGTGTVLPSFASIALGEEDGKVDERVKHIAVIQAMLVWVNREWMRKHGEEERKERIGDRMEAGRDVEMVA